METRQFACISGTDRGIGLALVHELLQADYTVFAGGISPDLEQTMSGLAERFPGRLHPFQLDVGSDASVQEAAARIAEHTDTLDLLINNAAILGETSATITDKLDFDDIQRVFNVSAVGALRLTHALIEPLLKGGKLIVNISSEAGSIRNSHRQRWFGYSMAKAAMNMSSTIIHNKIRSEGGRVLLLHPGWVKTSMGGQWSDEGTYTPEQSAAFIWQRIREQGHEVHDQPLYIEADTGNALPW
ncbi:SDR family NAD(P)-dependent oxidoreductase [Paenibacillus filicis]|uniref:SDR family NAD(P)-dependent oxidoreductase n=1 Tax=Paenibacillus filicis TaxID=669464 RepID=A0ABU9DCM9_9BACL